ncbi:uncharacterized protein LOC129778618 [Toxorhynchites rutilus septentrionalis]|uniref:uncharacterized protein LOC129778618 n=1 Tax=Toxorhynchites rutilus septentrionalis TaxID=329112 RepID=UPI002478564F|nr:uncharacterized protein LOC129778618 [Toxorhynchites rutilus septentrionalis]
MCKPISLIVMFGALVLMKGIVTYDPDDIELKSVIPPNGTFVAFYPRVLNGISNGNVRAPFSHGSFFKNRNPALVDVRNAAAYGYRFDGKRRFNFP